MFFLTAMKWLTNSEKSFIKPSSETLHRRYKPWKWLQKTDYDQKKFIILKFIQNIWKTIGDHTECTDLILKTFKKYPSHESAPSILDIKPKFWT